MLDPVAEPAGGLAEALRILEARGLRRGVQELAPQVARGALSTGHGALDAALRSGGWPRGALASVDAAPGSGSTTLALRSLAAAQEQGGLVAWLDLDGIFDPAIAAQAGVDLEWLLVVRPRDAEEAVDLASWLGRSGLIDLFVLDLGYGNAPVAALDRLGALLARVDGTGLLIGARGAVRGAGVRVALRRQAWLAVGQDLVGQRVEAVVERHRWALAGGSAELDLWFGEGRRIDPLLPALAAPRSVEERPALRVVRSA